MNDPVQGLARELADAIAAAVTADPRVAACRAKARVAGYDLRVTLDAVIGFAERRHPAPAGKRPAARRTPPLLNAHDRRFLRSLRIAPDDTTEPVERPE